MTITYICTLCELPIVEFKEIFHTTASGNIYCDECWLHRKDEVQSLQGDSK